jgi:hypothetical protein
VSGEARGSEWPRPYPPLAVGGVGAVAVSPPGWRERARPGRGRHGEEGEEVGPGGPGSRHCALGLVHSGLFLFFSFPVFFFFISVLFQNN